MPSYNRLKILCGTSTPVHKVWLDSRITPTTPAHTDQCGTSLPLPRLLCGIPTPAPHSIHCSPTPERGNEHNTSEPLFLYMPHQALHVSANKFPVEAPQEYIDMFAYIESDMRRGLAAAAYSMDESIGAVVERLHSKQMLKNSIRVPAFIWSPLLNKSGYVSDAMIHVTDVLPTILDAVDNSAGILNEQIIYGKSQWSVLSNNELPVRTEIIHNVDSLINISAIRWYDWKLIQNPKLVVYERSGLWVRTLGYQNNGLNREFLQSLQSKDRVNSKSYKVLRQMNRRPDYEVLKESVVECEPHEPTDPANNDCTTELCLFNIRHDPCEYHNLIGETDPQFVKFLWQKLIAFNETSVPPLTVHSIDPRSDPKLHNNTWINWLDREDMGDSMVMTRSEL
ncbi:unnamed protein product [Oppiella nova]|uniref:Uncharacterized protein n=1 Tax=Oppiella nova TaxID=334625 RepID=A0A7R9MF44_9ACAR|nr:unnamed protein product [Oppiella nova]CAG2176181.1 unnamed protein product [Oppiella nova]